MTVVGPRIAGAVAAVPEAAAPAPDGAALSALAERLQAACLERGITVALAESCTGGLVSHVITEIAGSSGYFQGGIVSYSNAVKHGQLGVPEEVLTTYGAVSPQTARAMAEGVRTRLHVDLVASVTGVAGPGGGSTAKAVGLTYIATADAHGAEVRRFVWPFDRSGNKRASAAAVLELLIERVAGQGSAAVSGGASGEGAATAMSSAPSAASSAASSLPAPSDASAAGHSAAAADG